MFAGQKLVDALGNDVCLFPMKTLDGSQFMNGAFSHKGAMLIDNVGEDGGIDNVYASCRLKCSHKDAVTADGVNGVNYWTVKPVLCSDKKYRHLTLRYIHDNDTSDIVVGHVYEQGERIGNEGTKGYATGNHSHFGVGEGHIEGAAITRNIYGVYEMINELNPVDVFFINGTIMKRDGGYAWQTYIEETTYQTHIQNVGASPIAKDWDICGTVGQSLRVEAVIIHGHCTYRTHVQDIGWLPYVRGEWSGTMGESKRMECVEIIADDGYTIEARAHVQDIGWMPVQYGKHVTIGTTGKSKRLEALMIKIVKV